MHAALALAIDSNGKGDARHALLRFAKLLSMRERETKALSSLATRMRFTQQSQMHARTAARAMNGVHDGPKLWERSRPWEDG